METNFDVCFAETSIDNVCLKWTELFLNVAKATIPNRVVTIRPNDSPWFTTELRKLKRKIVVILSYNYFHNKTFMIG